MLVAMQVQRRQRSSATKAMTPARRGLRCQRNAGDDDSAMLAILPAQCGQGHQRNAGKDASAASAGPSKIKLPWNGAGYGNEATGEDNLHDDNSTYADKARLHYDGADASLGCWRQRECEEDDNTSVTRAKLSTRRGQ
jgi:hypothetical protein